MKSAEKYYSISPYAYVGNNPMAFIDSNGQRRLGVVPEVEVDPEEEDGESYYTEDQSSIEAILDYIFERVTGTSNLYDTSKIKDHQDRIAADMKNLQTRTAALEQSAQTVNTVADVLASVIPFGSVIEAGNKVSYGQELSGGDIAFAAMDILPMGVVGKAGKAGKLAKLGKNFSFVSTVIRTSLSNRVGKRGFTEVEYQFQKHSGRSGGSVWKRAIPEGATLSPETYNKVGYGTFKEIWRAPENLQKVGGFIEKRLPDGRGIRIQENGVFKGFLD